MKIKNLYRGIFNYQRSVHKPIYRHVYSPYQAWMLMTAVIAKEQDVDERVVRNYFPWVEGGKSQNYEITLEMEYREADQGDN